jgi:hypothetical protein
MQYLAAISDKVAGAPVGDPTTASASVLTDLQSEFFDLNSSI